MAHVDSRARPSTRRTTGERSRFHGVLLCMQHEQANSAWGLAQRRHRCASTGQPNGLLGTSLYYATTSFSSFRMVIRGFSFFGGMGRPLSLNSAMCSGMPHLAW
jgi:hypothetical protein